MHHDLKGDTERVLGFPISYLMDRKTINIGKSQIGFIDVIIEPSFHAFAHVAEIPGILEQVKQNKEDWGQTISHYEEMMEKENEFLTSASTTPLKSPIQNRGLLTDINISTAGLFCNEI